MSDGDRPLPGLESSFRRPCGWRAMLRLGFAAEAGRTRLAERRHEGPLRVQRPFHPEGPALPHVYVVHPPGGVVGGDRLDIDIGVDGGARALLTTPAAGKFYRSAGAEARQTISLRVAADASLEWLPQETLLYPGTRARSRTLLRLADASSRAIAWDVLGLGLPARGAAYDHGQFRSALEVWLGERPLLIDQLRIDGERSLLDAACGFAGHRVLGTFVAFPATAADLAALRELDAASGPAIGLTLVDGLLVVRCLETHADAVMRRFAALWQALRPRLLGRAAVLPRIWAT